MNNAKETIETVKAVMEIAGDTPDLKEAGENLATTALTLTKAVNNCLLPIAAVNFGFEKAKRYFEEKFESDLSAKTSAIPAAQVVEPKVSLAAPVLQGIAFSYEEAALKDMYLNLLSASMDGRKTAFAHPAFAEIIKQLTTEEAQLLNVVFRPEGYTEIVKIKLQINKSKKGYVDKYYHLINLTDTVTGKAKTISEFPSFVDNWIRLGLIRVNYSEYLTHIDAYSWVVGRPEYQEIQSKLQSNQSINFDKGNLSKTAFGKKFASIVL